MALLHELIQAVGRSAELTDRQAEGAVGAALRFLASRLPSPLFGELLARLNAPPERWPDTGPAGPSTPEPGRSAPGPAK